MFQISATLIAPTIDMASYRKALINHFDYHLEQGIRRYIKAIAFNVVPVWSGASVATFLKLAALADYSLSVTPRTSRGRISLGKSSSGADIQMNGNRGQFHFLYETSLPHLVFNEYNNANMGGDPRVYSKLIQPGPYGFQNIGKAVFLSYAKSVRMPNPYKYMRLHKESV